jgi:hypothetical protein
VILDPIEHGLPDPPTNAFFHYGVYEGNVTAFSEIARKSASPLAATKVLLSSVAEVPQIRAKDASASNRSRRIFSPKSTD